MSYLSALKMLEAAMFRLEKVENPSLADQTRDLMDLVWACLTPEEKAEFERGVAERRYP